MYLKLCKKYFPLYERKYYYQKLCYKEFPKFPSRINLENYLNFFNTAKKGMISPVLIEHVPAWNFFQNLYFACAFETNYPDFADAHDLHFTEYLTGLRPMEKKPADPAAALQMFKSEFERLAHVQEKFLKAYNANLFHKCMDSKQ
jgi:hypothetical protein